MNNQSTVWIGDLDLYIDETFLKEAFASLGEAVCSIKIIRKTDDTLSYGFLEFPDEESAQRVLHQYNGKFIPNATNGRRFKLNHANYGKDNTFNKDFSLFVGDLSPEVDDLALFEAFLKKYSTVKLAKVIYDSYGVSKGYGFVRFTNKSEYESALVYMQNVHIGSKPIRVSTAQPKRLSASGMTGTTEEQQWQQQYPGYDYQSYYAAWQNYQTQNQYYNYDQRYAGYGAYQYPPQQYPYAAASTTATTDATAAAAAATPQTATPQQAAAQPQYGQANYEAVENVTEEHDVPLDVDQLNEELMQRNEELYTAMDDSRWLPIDNLNPPLVRIK